MEFRQNKLELVQSCESSEDNLDSQKLKGSKNDDAKPNKSNNVKWLYTQILDYYNKLKSSKTMTGKTKHCTACEKGCLRYALNGFKSNFIKAYIVKVGVAFLFMLLKRKLYNFVLNSDNIRFALVPSLFSFIHRGVKWSLRYMRDKEDGYNTIISAILGSWVMLIDNDRQRRTRISLYIFSRAIHSFIQLLEK